MPPDGYEPERLRALSRDGSDLVTSFIEAILSSDEDQIQKKLALLAEYLSGKNSSAAWLNLGRLAASLFFHRAAEEYFEKSARLAQAQRDDKGQSQAWNLIGSLYDDDEDWDHAGQFYEKALQALEEGKSQSLMRPILVNQAESVACEEISAKAEQGLFPGFASARCR